ncbi:hypothetical protein GIR35_05265 [Enterococcus faecalis]|nr:hypothetical protein GIR35_05265 [Enterococcus faecalis]
MKKTAVTSLGVLTVTGLVVMKRKQQRFLLLIHQQRIKQYNGMLKTHKQ